LTDGNGISKGCWLKSSIVLCYILELLHKWLLLPCLELPIPVILFRLGRGLNDLQPFQGKHLWMLFSLQELSIPVKFAGTGEGLNGLQPFDVDALMSCSFPWDVNGSSSLLEGADLMHALWLWQDPITVMGIDIVW
jgi:hypothetical protein